MAASVGSHRLGPLVPWPLEIIIFHVSPGKKLDRTVEPWDLVGTLAALAQ